ncbi:ABC transporter substrate-binding protein, partial [Elstera litoralis]
MVQFRSFAVALGLSTALITGFAQAQMTLRIANLGEPDTLDPQNMSGTWENRIAGDLYLGLTTEAADASVIPGTAESWTISPDGTVYTFKIRNDANWSDGTPVTAEDFVYAYRRIMDEARRKIRLDPL